MILDNAYFKGGLLSIGQAGSIEVQELLDDYINRYEPEFMRKALGYALSKSFTDGIDIGSGDTMEDKWSGLLNGAEFTNRSGRKEHWLGFSDINNSPIANYVFWHYLRDQFNQSVGIGVVKPEGENSTVVSPQNKMIAAWNDMIDQVKILWQFLEVSTSIYTDYDFASIDYRCFGCYQSSGYQNIYGV